MYQPQKACSSLHSEPYKFYQKFAHTAVAGPLAGPGNGALHSATVPPSSLHPV